MRATDIMPTIMENGMAVTWVEKKSVKQSAQGVSCMPVTAWKPMGVSRSFTAAKNGSYSGVCKGRFPTIPGSSTPARPSSPTALFASSAAPAGSWIGTMAMAFSRLLALEHCSAT